MDHSPRQQDEGAERSPDREIEPAEKPEKVKDRPDVSTVTPDDYPLDQRAGFHDGDRQ